MNNISALRKQLIKYLKPNYARVCWELAITLSLYVLCIALGYKLFAWNFYYCIPLILIGGLIQVRLFVLQHDLGHGGFLQNRKLAAIVGSILSIINATPYFYWAKCHNIHHATANNLDSQDIGSINFITVGDYQKLSAINKLGYRLLRNPFIFLCIISWVYFYIYNRFTLRRIRQHPRVTRLDIMSVYYTNILVVGYFALIIYLVGIHFFLMVMLPMLIISPMIGMLLFYIQHNFPETYAARDQVWEPNAAAIAGSSYFKLPKILSWFTGNIGYHHIHHLLPKIPFYRLPMIYTEHSELQQAKILELKHIPLVFKYKLWNEQRDQLITWKEFKSLHLKN